MPDPVEVQFLPSGKKVKAYLGQNIGMIAKAANVEIKYSCKKGETFLMLVDRQIYSTQPFSQILCQFQANAAHAQSILTGSS